MSFDGCAAPGRRRFRYPDQAAADYAAASPFAHAVFDQAWEPQLLDDCKREIASFDGWAGQKDFFGSRKKRYCGDIEALPPSVAGLIREASSPAFLDWLSALTGEQALLPDPYLEGGGIHQIVSGGFLKVHADFNWNKRLQLYRRLNVLIYLNPGWDERWGGALELWHPNLSACARRVFPHHNTMVVFTTDDHSFHGHPQPLECPEHVTRDSIALYYYSPIRPKSHFAARRKQTDYRPVGEEQFAVRNSWLKRIGRRVRGYLGR